ncbi:MAG: RtcB family protein [Lachnospiraceae bacterium]|nr:RtcB family protein [Lachnospiraceae bacterium]
MKTINGVYTLAKIFTTNNENTAIDDYAIAQLQMLCNNETSKDCIIRVMPDVHPGKVGTIGLTMTTGNKIMPNLVGIDIGCGISLAQIKGKKIEYQKLDTVIRQNVPSGFAIRKKMHHLAEEFDLSSLYCYKHIRKEKALLSLGSLGSSNHFIEAGKDEDGNLYIVIHSGSRHLGKEVTEHYLDLGQKELKAKGFSIPYEMTYLQGATLESYLHDIQIVQDFASLNRQIILDELVKGMKWKVIDKYDCIHNYIDSTDETLNTFGSAVLRKGAISAKKEENVIIPINMRDGIILGKGLGNRDWNCSAPHGSGRIMKREDIKSNYTVSEYKKQMKGIYSSCIGKDTLDEAPFAYRGIEDILDAISETVTVTKLLKPIYNFKAGDN